MEKGGRTGVSARVVRGRGTLPRPALFFGGRPPVARPSLRPGSAGARARLRAAGALLLCSAALCLLAPPSATAEGAWVRQRTGTLAWLRGVYFADERRGWAVGGRGALLATEDGGATWRPSPAPSEDSLRDIYFADAANGWIVCERALHPYREGDGPRSYLLRTTDGGRSWSRAHLPDAGADGRLVGVRFADASHGWAFGELGAVYATRDGGSTWARQSVPTRRLLLGAEFLDARRGWLVGAGGTLLRTEDGGANWREGRLLAAGEGRVEQAAGAAAQKSEGRDATRLNAVDFTDELRGWAVGPRGAIYSTEDGGRTWRAQASGVGADLRDVKFTSPREGWAVGGEGLVLRTRDGGRTWAAERPVTPHGLERLFAAGPARLWAVGFGGTIIALKD